MLELNDCEVHLVEFTIDSEISPSDPLLRRSIFEVHKGICFYTKAPMDFSEMHIDHIYPQALGGKNSIANYFPSCGSINSLKSARYCNQATNELLSINRLLYAPRVLRRYVELKQASGIPAKKMVPKKLKTKLIEETMGGEYRLIQMAALKKFLRTFSEKHPSNIKVIPDDRIIIFYDSISNSSDIENEIIHSWQYHSQFLQNPDDSSWTPKEMLDSIGYDLKHISWYKKKPYVERNRIELTFYIADISDAILGFKLLKGVDITEKEIMNVEKQQKAHKRKVHELISQIAI